MEVMKIKGLTDLVWKPADCHVTKIRSTFEGPATAMPVPRGISVQSSRMTATGKISLLLFGKRATFGWVADQLIEYGGQTGKLKCRVDYSVKGVLTGAHLQDESGMNCDHLKSHVVLHLARMLTPVWSEQVFSTLRNSR